MMDEAFHTTRWTRVVAAKDGEPDAKSALSELCEIYYGPVHRFIRHSAPTNDDGVARDLTHSFFEKILRGGGIEGVDRKKGRFRSYLLGAVKHFLSDHQKCYGAAKRGHGLLESIDESAMDIPDATPTRDSWFDRQWAFALLGRVMQRLAEEHDRSGKLQLFETLKPWLNGNLADVSQTSAARDLGISEGAVKVAIHRLRKRFRALVKNEVAQTVATESEISEELEYLIEALG